MTGQAAPAGRGRVDVSDSGAGPERPRLVVMVHNGITGDSRVVKTALAAARAGWDVTLLGWARDKRRKETWMGPVRVLRVPLTRTLHDRFEAELRAAQPTSALGPTRRLLGRFATVGLDRLRVTQRTLAGGSAASRLARCATGLLARAIPPGSSAGQVAAKPVLSIDPDAVVWRRDWPIFNDWWLSYRTELRRIRPHVIHANDTQMIGVAARYAKEVGTRRDRCAWVYDSHEFVPSVDWGGTAVSSAYRQHEAEFIADADAVVTVSEQMAEMIAEMHGLQQMPAVVANAPIAGVAAGSASVRHECAVAEGVPLLVYSGLLAPKRGLDVVIDGLAQLPGVHLAIVCSGKSALLDELMERARGLGVQDRVHVAGYVAPAAVPAYLSSADLGLAPFHWTANYDSSLPTKMPEYLHARLPIVGSDMLVMAQFLRSTGTGTVFAHGDVDAFADAVRRALSDLPKHRAAITEELLNAYSWEHQAATLVQVYSRISGLHPIERDVPWDVLETVERPSGSMNKATLSGPA